jgi:hypothetical protein
MGFFQQLKQFSKIILFTGICSFSTLVIRPRRSFALEPLPIIKILDENIEKFQFDIEVSHGKVGQAIINFRNRTPEEQLVYDKQKMEVNYGNEKGRYYLLRILEPHKRFDEEGRINHAVDNLGGTKTSYYIKEVLPEDSILRKDHYVKGRLVHGVKFRIRPPYFQQVDDKLTEENKRLVEDKKQLLFENEQLAKQIKHEKKI